MKHRKTGKRSIIRRSWSTHATRTPLSTNKNEKSGVAGVKIRSLDVLTMFFCLSLSLSLSLSFIRVAHARASCSGFANTFEQQCSHVHIARVLPLILHVFFLPSLRTSWQNPRRASWPVTASPGSPYYTELDFRKPPSTEFLHHRRSSLPLYEFSFSTRFRRSFRLANVFTGIPR